MRLTRRYSFEAAHQLSSGLPDDHPCRRLHGHHYDFEVTIEGGIDEDGFVLEYGALDEIVAPVLERYDHRFVNDFLTPSTVERICHDIWGMLQPRALKVRVWETARSSVEYP